MLVNIIALVIKYLLWGQNLCYNTLTYMKGSIKRLYKNTVVLLFSILSLIEIQTWSPSLLKHSRVKEMKVGLNKVVINYCEVFLGQAILASIRLYANIQCFPDEEMLAFTSWGHSPSAKSVSESKWYCNEIFPKLRTNKNNK